MSNYINSIPISPQYSVNQEGCFICSYKDCGKVFRFKSEIKRHVIKHSEERPF